MPLFPPPSKIIIASPEDIDAALATKADLVHNHIIGDVTGLQTALDEKAIASDVTTALAGKAPTVHNHIIGDVTGLQTALDAKASTSYVDTSITSARPIYSATVPANPYLGMIWHELSSNLILETWVYAGSPAKWYSLTTYEMRTPENRTYTAGVSLDAVFDNTYNILCKELLVTVTYDVGTVNASNYWRVFFKWFSPSLGGIILASSSYVASQVTGKFAINSAPAMSTGNRFIFEMLKSGAPPDAALSAVVRYQLIRK